jgi:hypothetical protein
MQARGANEYESAYAMRGTVRFFRDRAALNPRLFRIKEAY